MMPLSQTVFQLRDVGFELLLFDVEESEILWFEFFGGEDQRVSDGEQRVQANGVIAQIIRGGALQQKPALFEFSELFYGQIPLEEVLRELVAHAVALDVSNEFFNPAPFLAGDARIVE